MTAMKYLLQIDRLDKQINNKQFEIYQLKELATSVKAVTYDTDRVQTSLEGDKIGNAISKIVEEEDKLANLVMKYMAKKRKIIDQIEQLDKPIYARILFLRYVERKTYEEIACETCYSFRNVTRLHKKALAEFENMHLAQKMS